MGDIERESTAESAFQPAVDPSALSGERISFQDLPRVAGPLLEHVAQMRDYGPVLKQDYAKQAELIRTELSEYMKDYGDKITPAQEQLGKLFGDVVGLAGAMSRRGRPTPEEWELFDSVRNGVMEQTYLTHAVWQQWVKQLTLTNPRKFNDNPPEERRLARDIFNDSVTQVAALRALQSQGIPARLTTAEEMQKGLHIMAGHPEVPIQIVDDPERDEFRIMIDARGRRPAYEVVVEEKQVGRFIELQDPSGFAQRVQREAIDREHYHRGTN